jgi:hypothetical protein
VNSKVATALIVVLLAVAAAAGVYITQLHSENALLRTRIADSTAQKSSAPAAPAAAPAATRAPAAPAAPAPPGAARAARPPRVLTDGQKKSMLESLRAETGKVWFTTTPNDPEANTYQNALQSVFQEAGWEVQSDASATFGLRPGIYFLMADETPPSYVLTALGAFNTAEITVSAGRGYRQFNEEKKKENPNWRGFDLAPDQTFIIAVGPQPADATPTP